MELQTLKELFFQGEAEAINAFCSELKPRCLRETEIMDVNDIPTLLLIYTLTYSRHFNDESMSKLSEAYGDRKKDSKFFGAFFFVSLFFCQPLPLLKVSQFAH